MFTVYSRNFDTLELEPVAVDTHHTLDTWSPALYGGGVVVPKTFRYADLAPFIVRGFDLRELSSPVDRYELVKYAPSSAVDHVKGETPGVFTLDLPLSSIVLHLNVVELRAVARVHNVHVARGASKGCIIGLLLAHKCAACERYSPFFLPRSASQTEDWFDTSPEVVGSLVKSIKALSFEELTATADIPHDLVDTYSLGARLQHLVPVTEEEPPEFSTIPDAIVSDLVPWATLVKKTTRAGLDIMAGMHGFRLLKRLSKPEAAAEFVRHRCISCVPYRAVYTPLQPVRKQRKSAQDCSEKLDHLVRARIVTDTPSALTGQPFPPVPLSDEANRDIIEEFCNDLTPACLDESGCAVCGRLTLLVDLTPLSSVTCSLQPLVEPGVARRPRISAADPVIYEDGPVLDAALNAVCSSCLKSLNNGKRPRLALANGLWIGEVPVELSHLTYVEQLLIARVRSNRSVVRVSSGQTKMVANAITFAQPMVKLYHTLPPARADLEEALAFIFTGVQPPGDEILERTPMLVRRNVVATALEWLKLNHADYADICIDYKTLASYPLSGVPVNIIYKKVVDGVNTVASATSMHETEDEQGTVDGPCPFKINGLIGDHLDTMTAAARSAIAAYHLRTGGHVLTVGHSEHAESMYDNPSLYPQLFPWLFPYGHGGMGSARLHGVVSEANHKKHLLMYHDKRFQEESRFVLIAFNQDQIKRGGTGSTILAKRRNFSDIAAKVARINPAVILNISHRLQEGQRVNPETQEEKDCFSVMDQLENVSVHVQGSMAGKKRMRSELWSLISCIGAPSWFITLSPADNKHPLCFFWADKKVNFHPELGDYATRARAVARNPVAGARFFHYLVQLLIKHILRWNDPKGRRGVFGHTSAYYGTVEQQGRLTLHLHMLVWIACALSPQQIRDRLMDKDSEFTRDIISYIESCQTGEFATGSLEEMQDKFELPRVFTPGSQRAPKREYRYPDPASELPLAPPTTECGDFSTCDCPDCEALREWRRNFSVSVDHIVYRSNIHSCYNKVGVTSKDGEYSEHVNGKGCINQDGICTARFPRKLYPESAVDEDGHLNVMKKEEWINTINKTMVYCFGCNTDCTSLLSGTAIKATAGYVADYIVKMGLKTYEIFSSIYDVFEKHQDLWADTHSNTDAARRLILKMANSLTSKVEIGGPMAAMYLLGHPDHYTSHSFVNFYWRQYVLHVMKEWTDSMSDLRDPTAVESARKLNSFDVDDECDSNDGASADGVDDDDEADFEEEELVIVSRGDGHIYSRSAIDDYEMRPVELSNVCLYDWVQCAATRSVKGLKNIPPELLVYEHGHPLHSTHRVVYDTERMLHVVPNMLGGYIPKQDGEDREFYCATMLTLFVPWRNGLELKASTETWDAAFTRRTFSERHQQLIANINIRYECYDARDDYHHQLRMRAAEIKENADTDDEEGLPDAEGTAEQYTDECEKGVWTQRKIDQMKEAETAMQAAGWVTGAQGNPMDIVKDFAPEKDLGTKAWRDIVKTARDKVLNSRLPPKTGSMEQKDDMDIDLRALNDVRIIPGSWLKGDFATHLCDEDLRSAYRDTIGKFKLNKEQKRAFSIVASHSTSMAPDPLRMYIGGMGGTGKTRVIDSLKHYFSARGESHRMTVLAPTGSAASVISGSTYHSFLGVATGNRRSGGGKGGKALDEARARMRGVEYIFLDEISMVSCQDLFLIDARLKEITRVYDVPFGGINVIVAGDFAQLPPAGTGVPLYSGEVSKVQLPRQTRYDQENTLGLFIWHSFVVVVVLTKNMRQVSKGHADVSLRKALTNMRYKSCTEEDIEWLRSRIPSVNRDLDISSPHFKNVSVITSWNSHKDQINKMNASRFAQESGVPLHTFYSVDKQTTPRRNNQPRRGPRCRRPPGAPQKSATQMPSVKLTREVQHALWTAAPHTSEHIAGSLSICVGMPVMIRNNDATEISITKGQEAVIRGWSSHEIPGHPDRYALDVLFVELVKPKTPVKLPYLEENVVPLTKIPVTIEAHLPNDSTIKISRQQVPVLLNFSMTDYASQGKTREVNVVDLARSKNHQAMYVSLSRGTSAAGTVILRDFSVKKITGGICGFLREEFRIIDALDEITRLNFEGALPDGIIGRLRSSTVRAYRTWRADGTLPVVGPESDVAVGKRKADVCIVDAKPRKKRNPAKRGVLAWRDGCSWSTSWVWDSRDWSCAYDSYITIIRWYTDYLFSSFNSVNAGSMTLDDCRLGVREALWKAESSLFPRGRSGTDICSLVQVVNGLMLHDHHNLSIRRCRTCGATGQGFLFESIGRYTVMRTALPRVVSIQDYLHTFVARSVDACDRCGGDRYVQHEYTQLLCVQTPTVGFDLVRDRLVIDRDLDLDGRRYKLAGVVYWSGVDSHFASRLVDSSGRVYRYDGMENHGAVGYEFAVKDRSHIGRLSTMDHRVASLAVYIKQ